MVTLICRNRGIKRSKSKFFEMQNAETFVELHWDNLWDNHGASKVLLEHVLLHMSELPDPCFLALHMCTSHPKPGYHRETVFFGIIAAHERQTVADQ